MDGVFQTDRDFKVGANNLDLVSGARYHPFSMRSVLWQRKTANAMDFFIEIVDGDKVYPVVSLPGTVLKSYVWPDAATPSKIDLTPAMRIRVRTNGAGPGEDQSAAVTWAELGAP